jgi:hypothetical protein
MSRPSLSALRARLRSITARSSLSDHKAYREACVTAAADDEIFSRFRSSGGAFQDILEHVSLDLAKAYTRELNLPVGASETELRLLQADVVGAPLLEGIPGVGLVSRSALRYLCVAQQMREYLQLSGATHILEIGVGYGGQVRVLADVVPGARFTLVDLPETLALARRYLQASGVTAPVEYVAANRIRSVSADVVICNYALSELRRKVQTRYIDAFVDPASSGFVTWNHISPRAFRSLTASDFAAMVGGRLIDERPLSYPGNQVVLWGLTKDPTARSVNGDGLGHA